MGAQFWTSILIIAIGSMMLTLVFLYARRPWTVGLILITMIAGIDFLSYNYGMPPDHPYDSTYVSLNMGGINLIYVSLQSEFILASRYITELVQI